MDYIITKSYGSEALYHHGIKGQRWGVRRYQNPDGTYTDAGKRRYIQDKTISIDKDIADLQKHLKTGIKTKKGQTVLTKEDIKNMVDGLLKEKDKQIQKYSNKWDKNVKYEKDKLAYKNIKKEAKKNKSIKRTRLYKISRAKRYSNISDKFVNELNGYNTNKLSNVNNTIINSITKHRVNKIQ